MTVTLVYGTHKIDTPITSGRIPLTYLMDVNSIEAAKFEARRLEASGFHVFRIMDERCERILMEGDRPLCSDELRLILNEESKR